MVVCCSLFLFASQSKGIDITFGIEWKPYKILIHVNNNKWTIPALQNCTFQNPNLHYYGVIVFSKLCKYLMIIDHWFSLIIIFN